MLGIVARDEQPTTQNSPTAIAICDLGKHHVLVLCKAMHLPPRLQVLEDNGVKQKQPSRHTHTHTHTSERYRLFSLAQFCALAK